MEHQWLAWRVCSGVLSAMVCVAMATGVRAEVAETPSYDVCVVGGGVSGVCAALQAARAGAKTVLVEQGFQVGGNMTTGGVNFPGLFHAWKRQIIAGVGWDLVTNCVAMAGDKLPDFMQDLPKEDDSWRNQVRVNIPLWIALTEEALTAAKVEVRYHTCPTSVTWDGTRWTVGLCAMGEMQSLTAGAVIDATGNGAVSALAGAERVRDSEDQQPGGFEYLFDPGVDIGTLNFGALEYAMTNAVRSRELEINDLCRGVKFFLEQQVSILQNYKTGPNHGTSLANYIVGADNSTAEKRTDTNMRGRASMLRVYRFLRKQSGLGNIRPLSVMPEVGVRETYRVTGQYVMTGSDYVDGKVFGDSLCYSYYPIDVHVQEPEPSRMLKGIRQKQIEEGTFPTVPLRCLQVKDKRNLFVVGRCISTDREVNSAVRVQATCMATGQVAGEAAAYAVKEGRDLWNGMSENDLVALRENLSASGAIVPPPPPKKEGLVILLTSAQQAR